MPVEVLPPGTFGVVGEREGVQERRPTVVRPGQVVAAERIGQRPGNPDLQVSSSSKLGSARCGSRSSTARQALGLGYAVEPVAEQGAFSSGERRRGPDGFAMVTAGRPGDLGAVRRGLA